MLRVLKCFLKTKVVNTQLCVYFLTETISLCLKREHGINYAKQITESQVIVLVHHVSRRVTLSHRSSQNVFITIIMEIRGHHYQYQAGCQQPHIFAHLQKSQSKTWLQSYGFEDGTDASFFLPGCIQLIVIVLDIVSVKIVSQLCESQQKGTVKISSRGKMYSNNSIIEKCHEMFLQIACTYFTFFIILIKEDIVVGSFKNVNYNYSYAGNN